MRCHITTEEPVEVEEQGDGDGWASRLAAVARVHASTAKTNPVLHNSEVLADCILTARSQLVACDWKT
jgi:hypothetical protein